MFACSPGPFWMTSWNQPTNRQHGTTRKQSFELHGKFSKLRRHTKTKPSNLLFSRELCLKLFSLWQKFLFSFPEFYQFIFWKTTWNLFQLWGNVVVLISSTCRNNRPWWEEYWQAHFHRRRDHLTICIVTGDFNMFLTLQIQWSGHLVVQNPSIYQQTESTTSSPSSVLTTQRVHLQDPRSNSRQRDQRCVSRPCVTCECGSTYVRLSVFRTRFTFACRQ